MADLKDRQCAHCEGDPLDDGAVAELLNQVDGWTREDQSIVRSFSFKDHHEAMIFVNAVAEVSHAQNHHPDMAVGYNTVEIRYATHSVGGLSDNDFICAAKVNTLV